MRRDEFQSLDVIEVARRLGFDLDRAGQLSDPVAVVIAAKSCTEKEAMEWLRSEFGGAKKDGKEEIVLMEEDVRKVKLAQDFADDNAMMTVGLFARNKERVMEYPFVITSKRELFPCTKDELAQRSICYDKVPFPSVRWPLLSVRQYLSGHETPTLHDCFRTVLNLQKEYIDFGDYNMHKFLALWIMGTYCFRLLESYPYIHLNGNPGSGKTKVLTFIALLSFNGEMMTSDSSRAAILRTIDSNCCTCCIDEVESLQNPQDDDARLVLALLNSGYKLGGGDKKCEKVRMGGVEQWVPVFYDGYCPKVLAGVKQLAITLMTRCIPIVMLRSQDTDVINRAIIGREPVWERVRSMLYPSLLIHWPDIARVYKNIQSITVAGREWELWKPIIALASVTDSSGTLANDMRRLAESVQTRRREIDTSVPLLLSMLLERLQDDNETEAFYSTERLYEHLSDADPDEYGWLLDPYRKSSRGKWLGNELRRAGVVQGRAELRSVGGKKSKGYLLNQAHITRLLSAYGGVVTEAETAASDKEDGTVTAE